MQNELTRLSTDHVHLIAVHSPHPVMTALGQAKLVVHAIGVAVDAVRSDAGLPRCRELFRAPGARCV